jgi:hypothetical protein
MTLQHVQEREQLIIGLEAQRKARTPIDLTHETLPFISCIARATVWRP